MSNQAVNVVSKPYDIMAERVAEYIELCGAAAPEARKRDGNVATEEYPHLAQLLFRLSSQDASGTTVSATYMLLRDDQTPDVITSRYSVFVREPRAVLETPLVCSQWVDCDYSMREIASSYPFSLLPPRVMLLLRDLGVWADRDPVFVTYAEFPDFITGICAADINVVCRDEETQMDLQKVTDEEIALSEDGRDWPIVVINFGLTDENAACF